MPIEIQPLAQTFGAELRGLDLAAPLDDATRKQIEVAVLPARCGADP